MPVKKWKQVSLSSAELIQVYGGMWDQNWYNLLQIFAGFKFLGFFFPPAASWAVFHYYTSFHFGLED